MSTSNFSDGPSKSNPPFIPPNPEDPPRNESFLVPCNLFGLGARLGLLLADLLDCGARASTTVGIGNLIYFPCSVRYLTDSLHWSHEEQHKLIQSLSDRGLVHVMYNNDNRWLAIDLQILEGMDTNKGGI